MQCYLCGVTFKVYWVIWNINGISYLLYRELNSNNNSLIKILSSISRARDNQMKNFTKNEKLKFCCVLNNVFLMPLT